MTPHEKAAEAAKEVMDEVTQSAILPIPLTIQDELQEKISEIIAKWFFE